MNIMKVFGLFYSIVYFKRNYLTESIEEYTISYTSNLKSVFLIDQITRLACDKIVNTLLFDYQIKNVFFFL